MDTPLIEPVIFWGTCRSHMLWVSMSAYPYTCDR